MGKWAARLAEKTTAPPYGGTDKTAERGVLSVLAVTPKGGACVFQAATMPASEAAERVEALDLAAVAWTDGDIARFLDRRARLLRWGWAEREAEMLAERLVKRDREGDDRRACAECRYGRSARCPDGAPLPAGVLHRCPGVCAMSTGNRLGPSGGSGRADHSSPMQAPVLAPLRRVSERAATDARHRARDHR